MPKTSLPTEFHDRSAKEHSDRERLPSWKTTGLGFLLFFATLSLALAGCAHQPPSSVPASESRGQGSSFPHTGNPSSFMTRSAPSPPLSSGATGAEQAHILGKDPRGCTWLESTGTATGGSSDPPKAIRSLAVSRAEDLAIRTLLGGEDVESTFLSGQSSYAGRSDQYVESDLRAQKRARILGQEILRSTPSFVSAGGCDDCLRTRIAVVLRTCVSPLPPDNHRPFVKISLNQPFYREGDMAVVRIFVGQDSYLYLIDENPADHTFSLIVPDPRFLALWQAKTGETATFPSGEISREGIALEAELPKGASESFEVLRVIATTKPLPPDVWLSNTKTTFDLFGRLNRLDIPYNDDATTFTILGKKKARKETETIRLRSSTTH